MEYTYKDFTVYPTIDYIRKTSTEDMTINVGSSVKAEIVIMQITDQFKQGLSEYHTNEMYNYIEYKVATDELWRKAWLKAISNVVFEDYNSLNDRFDTIMRVIKSTPYIKNKRRAIEYYEYRVGY